MPGWREQTCWRNLAAGQTLKASPTLLFALRSRADLGEYGPATVATLGARSRGSSLTAGELRASQGDAYRTVGGVSNV